MKEIKTSFKIQENSQIYKIYNAYKNYLDAKKFMATEDYANANKCADVAINELIFLTSKIQKDTKILDELSNLLQDVRILKKDLKVVKSKMNTESI